MRSSSLHAAGAGSSASARSGGSSAGTVALLRAEELYKVPGVGETITWARALLALGPEDDLDATLGVALKVREDLDRVREKGVLHGA